MAHPIPFHRPSTGAAEENALLEVLRSGWLTTGKKTQEAEIKIATFSGVDYGIGLNSCTAGLHLSLLSCGVGPGDEVITPSITFPACANVVLHVGANLVFADINRETLNISIDSIERSITSKTKALIVTHLYGQACDLKKIRKLCDAKKIFLIQDAAHALEAKHHGKAIATYGDITCYSFYATKNITSGEGGMLVTDHQEIYEKLSKWRTHGLSRNAYDRHANLHYQHWDMLYPGYKYNMYDLQAALLLAQWKRVEEFLQKRKSIANLYHEILSTIPDLVSTPKHLSHNEHCHHLYPIVLNLDSLTLNRDQVLQALGEKEIGVGVHFRPIHQMQYYREKKCYKTLGLTHAEWAGDRLFSIPLFPDLSLEDAQFVVETLRELLRKHQR